MAIDPIGLSKVKFVMEDTSGPVYPGMEAHIAGAPVQADVDAIAAAIHTAWITEMKALLSGAWVLAHVWVLYSTGTSILKGTSSSSDAGTLGGTLAGTRNDAVVTGYAIDDYYRGGKPRTYWPAPWRLASGSTTHWDAGLAGDFTAAVQALIDGINGAPTAGFDVTLGCIRRRSGGGALTPPQFFPYLGTHTDTRICSQRRRLGRL